MKLAMSKKTLLEIIGIVAVIAVIAGVTFAYLSASVTNNQIGGETYRFSMTLSVTRVDPASAPSKGHKLIPLTETDIDKAIESGCVDDNGYEVCEIYALTFQNTGSRAVTMSGSMTPISNGFDNIYYDVTDIGNDKTALTTGTQLSGLTAVTNGFTNLNIPIGSSTMYLIMYIKNNQTNNQPNDQARTFVGKIDLIDNASNAGRVQASFVAGE